MPARATASWRRCGCTPGAAASAPAAKPEPSPNRLVTDDRAAELREKLKAKEQRTVDWIRAEHDEMARLTSARIEGADSTDTATLGEHDAGSFI